jgi:hypothetical protein
MKPAVLVCLVCLTWGLATGCAGSVLIPRGDLTYRRAIERYQRTRREVTESLASDDEQAMFMQAEGLYRYRFEFPRRSTGAVFASLAASAIDLPVLETVAGSLDLSSLRLRTSDGAIQLWETLIARNATSPLRPFALYRLGWAYRNNMVSGFAGDTDVVFDALAKLYPASPLTALSRQAKDVPYKSPKTATAWSSLPGAGQLYVGKYGSGVVRLAIAAVAVTAVVAPVIVAYRRSGDLSWNRDWPLLVTGIAGATVLAIDYTNSYEDALRSVLEYNERREAAFEDAHPEAP